MYQIIDENADVIKTFDTEFEALSYKNNLEICSLDLSESAICDKIKDIVSDYHFFCWDDDKRKVFFSYYAEGPLSDKGVIGVIYIYEEENKIYVYCDKVYPYNSDGVDISFRNINKELKEAILKIKESVDNA